MNFPRIRALCAAHCSMLVGLALLAAANTSNAGPGGVSDGLSLWLRAETGINAADGAYVTTWSDESGNGRDAVWNPLNSYGEQAPIYAASNSLANGRSTVTFLNHEALEVDLSFLAGSDYTIFVVNGRNRPGLANFYIAGDSAVTNSNLVLGYEQPNRLRLAHFNNDLDAIVEDYFGSPVWSLDGFRFDQTLGRQLFHNGSLVESDSSMLPLLSNSGATLGHFRAYGPAYWFWGDLAEVVVYDRVLTEDERLLVESDLAGRYGFPLSVADYVPCDGPWKNHGEYVRAAAHAAAVLLQAGVSSPGDQTELVAVPAQSTCGKN